MTVEGVFRKSGSVRKVEQIVHALNFGGEGVTVDLSQLDSVTLANVFKKFLADLPDSVITGRLFDLLIAASREY